MTEQESTLDLLDLIVDTADIIEDFGLAGLRIIGIKDDPKFLTVLDRLAAYSEQYDLDPKTSFSSRVVQALEEFNTILFDAILEAISTGLLYEIPGGPVAYFASRKGTGFRITNLMGKLGRWATTIASAGWKKAEELTESGRSEDKWGDKVAAFVVGSGTAIISLPVWFGDTSAKAVQTLGGDVKKQATMARRIGRFARSQETFYRKVRYTRAARAANSVNDGKYFRDDIERLINYKAYLSGIEPNGKERKIYNYVENKILNSVNEYRKKAID